MICKNCDINFDGNFCNNCGQSAKVRKINTKFFFEEIQGSIFQVNRGFLFTVKELFTRPGQSIREFIEGKRKNHIKPLAFLVLTSSLYLLINYLFEHQTIIATAIKGYNMADGSSDGALSTFIKNNQTYFILLLLPSFSLASYLAFIKAKYNFYEHIILNLYITGQQMLIYTIFSFIDAGKDEPIVALPLILGVAFNSWSYLQFFNKENRFKKIILTIFTYIIFILLTILGMGMLLAILKFIE
jgi:hypothetical protein